MTSREDSLALVTRYYRLFNDGDRQALLDLLSDDVRHDINQGHSETGRQAFCDFFKKMDRSYRERVEELEVMSNDDGTRCAAEFFIHGTYLATDEGLPPATGQTYRLRVGAFFEIRHSRIARVTNHYNLQDWLHQVGA
jgi:steroid delta-isomerase-like uncharacterized protein